MLYSAGGPAIGRPHAPIALAGRNISEIAVPPPRIIQDRFGSTAGGARAGFAPDVKDEPLGIFLEGWGEWRVDRSLPMHNGRGRETSPGVIAQERPACRPGHPPTKCDRVSGVAVTQSQLAQALGVSARTLERWARLGMPVLAVRGAYGRPRYDLAACRNWAVSHPTQGQRSATPNPTNPTNQPDTPDTPQLEPWPIDEPAKRKELTPSERLAKARATDLEIKLHRRRGDILTKGQVEAEWTRQGRVVRGAMLEVPAALAVRYPGVEGLEDTCRHLIIDAMKHLAAAYEGPSG